MRIEIDQSIKIEQTNKITAIGLSNSVNITVSIYGKDKKEIQQYFRSNNQPRLFVVLTFCALVAYAIREGKELASEIIIDREYPGYDELIKEKVVAYLAKLKINLDPSQLSIELVGKKSNAHSLAYTAAKNNSAKITITAPQILKLVQTKNRGVLKKRLSRLVGTPPGFSEESVSPSQKKVNRKR